MIKERTAGMYLHIPFCFSKCRYCSFVSAPVQGATDSRVNKYIRSLLHEMDEQSGQWTDMRFDSLFIGGGTPSILPAPYIPQLIDRAKYRYMLDADAEITVEVNPESFTPEKAYVYAQAGVNRLSFGVQSTREEELRLLGRPHSWEDAMNALDYAHMAHIDNISVDLIYNLPGQSTESFLQSVCKVLDLGVGHLSCYALTLEEGTPLYMAVERGELPPPDDDVAADMWERTAMAAKRYGLCRYEISNYAKEGRAGRHNLHYWHQDGYLGLGVAAHSARDSESTMLRMHNTESIDGYLQKGPQQCAEHVAGQEKMFEYVMLHTRLTCGLSLDDFCRRFGESFEIMYASAIKRAAGAGLAKITDERFCLTDRGMLLQNSVLMWFML